MAMGARLGHRSVLDGTSLVFLYVNWLYGWSMAAAATQPAGHYVATFQVRVTAAGPLKAERTVPGQARVNIRGMNGTRPSFPPDARLEFTEVP